jgi:hypothetical protein
MCLRQSLSKGGRLCLAVGLMKIYIFYYEVLLGQSKNIDGLSDFHQKEKMKKRKKIPKKY